MRVYSLRKKPVVTVLRVSVCRPNAPVVHWKGLASTGAWGSVTSTNIIRSGRLRASRGSKGETETNVLYPAAKSKSESAKKPPTIKLQQQVLYLRCMKGL